MENYRSNLKTGTEPRNAPQFWNVTKFYYISISQTSKLKIIDDETCLFKIILQSGQSRKHAHENIGWYLMAHIRIRYVTVNITLKSDIIIQ